MPGEQHVGVHRVAGAGAPQRQRVLLAVVIDEHAVAAVERALRHGIDQPERRHHGAGRKHLDLEVAAGHVVDRLGVVERVFVEDILRRPRALEAHGDRPLRLDDARCDNGAAPATAAPVRNLRRVDAADSLLLGIVVYPPLDHYPVNIFRRVLFHDPAFRPGSGKPLSCNRTGCSDRTQHWAAFGGNLRRTVGAPSICPFYARIRQNRSNSARH